MTTHALSDATVWIVERFWPYESSNVEGVFSTELAALRYIAAQAKEGTGANYSHFQMVVDAKAPLPIGTTQGGGA